MKVIVDIPKEMRKSIEDGSFGAKYNMYDLCGCIMNGTVLPEGHGKLIDVNELKVTSGVFCPKVEGNGYSIPTDAVLLDDIRETPGVIEADLDTWKGIYNHIRFMGGNPEEILGQSEEYVPYAETHKAAEGDSENAETDLF